MRGLTRDELNLLGEVLAGSSAPTDRSANARDIELIRKLARRGLLTIDNDNGASELSSLVLTGGITPMGRAIFMLYRSRILAP